MLTLLAVELVANTVLQAVVLLSVVPFVAVGLVADTFMEAVVLLSVAPYVAVELVYPAIGFCIYASSCGVRYRLHAGSRGAARRRAACPCG